MGGSNRRINVRTAHQHPMKGAAIATRATTITAKGSITRTTTSYNIPVCALPYLSFLWQIPENYINSSRQPIRDNSPGGRSPDHPGMSRQGAEGFHAPFPALGGGLPAPLQSLLKKGFIRAPVPCGNDSIPILLDGSHMQPSSS